MNIADLILLIVWCFFAARGYSRGLIQETASFFGIFAAIYFANHYHTKLAPYLVNFMSSSEYTSLAAYIIIVISVILAVRILVLGMTGLIKLAMVQWANNFFGLAFGLAKGVVITALVLMIMNAFGSSSESGQQTKNHSTLFGVNPEITKNSKLLPYVYQASQLLTEFTPPEVKQKIQQTLSSVPVKKQP